LRRALAIGQAQPGKLHIGQMKPVHGYGHRRSRAELLAEPRRERLGQGRLSGPGRPNEPDHDPRPPVLMGARQALAPKHQRRDEVVRRVEKGGGHALDARTRCYGSTTVKEVGVRSVRVMVAWLTVLASLTALAGCGAASPESLGGELRLLAPTSLQNVLPVLVYQFTTTHGGVHIATTFGPDVRPSVPGDVLLAEGPSALTGTTGPATVFATDQFVLAVALGDPLAVGDVGDLARPGLRVARCAPVQPCGQYADAI